MTVTITELRAMALPDLRKELRAQHTYVRKMRLQITMNTEKDTGRYRREKRQLARMMMVMGEKAKETLKKKPKTATVSAPKKSRTTSS